MDTSSEDLMDWKPTTPPEAQQPVDTFNKSRVRKFDEFAWGEQVEMDRVQEAYGFEASTSSHLMQPFNAPSNAPSHAATNTSTLTQSAHVPEERQFTWAQRIVQTVAISTVVVTVISKAFLKSACQGAFRAGRFFYKNRQQIRETCTTAVQSTCNTAKRRMVFIATEVALAHRHIPIPPQLYFLPGFSRRTAGNRAGRREVRYVRTPRPEQSQGNTAVPPTPLQVSRTARQCIETSSQENGEYVMSGALQNPPIEGLENPHYDPANALLAFDPEGDLDIGIVNTPNISPAAIHDDVGSQSHATVAAETIPIQQQLTNIQAQHQAPNIPAQQQLSDIYIRPDLIDPYLNNHNHSSSLIDHSTPQPLLAETGASEFSILSDSTDDMECESPEDENYKEKPQVYEFVDEPMNILACIQLQKAYEEDMELSFDESIHSKMQSEIQNPQPAPAPAESVEPAATVPTKATPIQSLTNRLSPLSTRVSKSSKNRRPRRKNVNFFESPKTRRPVTKTKNFILGEAMNFPVSSSPHRESIPSNISSNIQSHDSPTITRQADFPVSSSPHRESIPSNISSNILSHDSPTITRQADFPVSSSPHRERIPSNISSNILSHDSPTISRQAASLARRSRKQRSRISRAFMMDGAASDEDEIITHTAESPSRSGNVSHSQNEASLRDITNDSDVGRMTRQQAQAQSLAVSDHSSPIKGDPADLAPTSHLNNTPTQTDLVSQGPVRSCIPEGNPPAAEEALEHPAESASKPHEHMPPHQPIGSRVGGIADGETSLPSQNDIIPSIPEGPTLLQTSDNNHPTDAGDPQTLSDEAHSSTIQVHSPKTLEGIARTMVGENGQTRIEEHAQVAPGEHIQETLEESNRAALEEHTQTILEGNTQTTDEENAQMLVEANKNIAFEGRTLSTDEVNIQKMDERNAQFSTGEATSLLVDGNVQAVKPIIETNTASSNVPTLDSKQIASPSSSSTSSSTTLPKVARSPSELNLSQRRRSVRRSTKDQREQKSRAEQAAIEAAEKARKAAEEAEEKARKAEQEAEERARKAAEEVEEKARKEKEEEEERRRKGIRRFPKEKIIQPLTAEWESKVKAALDTPDMQQVLVTLPSGTKLTRKDLGTVKAVRGRDPAHGWLNDEIILAALQQVVEYGLRVSGHQPDQTPTYHVFNTFFYKNLRDKGAQSIKRWATKAKIGGKALEKVERVFIPVHQGAHWTLLVVSPVARTIEYFDSMGGRADPYIRNAKLWLAQEMGRGWKEEEWSVPTGTVGAGPRQANGSDCGVFTCTTARMVVLGVDPLAYGGEDMETQRGRIVAELLNGGLTGEFEPCVVF